MEWIGKKERRRNQNNRGKHVTEEERNKLKNEKIRKNMGKRFYTLRGGNLIN